MASWDNKKIIYAPRRSIPRGGRGPLLLFIGMVLGIGVLGYAVYALLMQKNFMVHEVQITGINSILPHDIQSVAGAYFSQKVWNLFPRSEYFFISTFDLGNYIKAKIPEIKDIAVDKSFPHTVDVNISERSIWGVVCNATPNATTSTEYPNGISPVCVYVDDSAFAFKDAPFFASGSLTKKIFTDEANVAVGQEPISANIVKLYDDINTIFTLNSVPVTSMVLMRETPRDIKIYSGDWYVLVDPDVDMDTLKNVFSELIQKTLKNNLNQIEYIDLRFGNKVFLKKKM